MNGETRRNVALALASFAIGVVAISVLGSPRTREKITERGKELLRTTENIANQSEVA